VCKKMEQAIFLGVLKDLLVVKILCRYIIS